MAFFEVIMDKLGRPRIAKIENGFRRDICGAETVDVAVTQVSILNRREAAGVGR